VKLGVTFSGIKAVSPIGLGNGLAKLAYALCAMFV